MSNSVNDLESAVGDERKRTREPLPVTVLSGFLGAGKTTLLKQILEQNNRDEKETYKLALLVNDMAALNIDSALVRDTQLVQQEEKLVELHNGCICCTLREDLLIALARFAAEDKYDAIVVEGTGISDPQEVAETFTYEFDDPSVPDEIREVVGDAPTLNDVARLDTCVTVVDCTTFFDRLSSAAELRDAFKGSADEDDERSVGPLLMGQIEFADVIVLNKTDLVTRDQAKVVEAAIRNLNTSAEVILSTRGNVPLEKVLCTGLFSLENAEESPGWLQTLRGEPVVPETEVYQISSFVYEQRTPFHPQRLLDFMEAHFTTRTYAELPPDHDHDHDDDDDDGGDNDDQATCDDDDDRCDDDTGEDPELKAKKEEEEKERAEHERENKIRFERTRAAFGNIMRSKGYLWIAGRDNQCGEWAHAGSVLEVKCGGCWMATLPREYWPPEGTDHHNQVLSDWHGDTLGDRRQALVFIGQNLKREAICAALDACLMTKDEAASDGATPENSEDDHVWKLGVKHLNDPFPRWLDLPPFDEGDYAEEDSEENTDGEAGVKSIATKSEWDKLLSNSDGKVIFVDFTATWCGPCKAIGPVFQKLAAETVDAIFVKVDVDKNGEVAQACGITSMPTFHCYKGGGKVDELVGASPDKLAEMIAKNM